MDEAIGGIYNSSLNVSECWPSVIALCDVTCPPPISLKFSRSKSIGKGEGDVDGLRVLRVEIAEKDAIIGSYRHESLDMLLSAH